MYKLTHKKCETIPLPLYLTELQVVIKYEYSLIRL